LSSVEVLAGWVVAGTHPRVSGLMLDHLPSKKYVFSGGGGIWKWFCCGIPV